MAKEDKANCIFCKIIAGQSPVSTIYEDDQVVVFVPLSYINPGHLLVVPKAHAPYIADLDDETAGNIMKIAHKMAGAVRKSKYKSEGVNLFLADGESAFQDVFHYHLHVFPRYKGDGFDFKYDEGRSFVELPRDELDEIAEEIKSHL